MAVLKTYQSKSYIGTEGKAPIYISFYIDRRKVVVSTGISVKVVNFDEKSGKIKTGEKNHKDDNLVLENVKSRINDIMVRYRLQKKELTRKQFFNEYNHPSDFRTFYEFVYAYLREHPHEIEASTLDVHLDVINKLKVYAPGLEFGEITEDFVIGYKGYLKKKLGNKDTTINKNMATLKKYFRKAVKAGYLSSDPFEGIKISRKSSGNFTFLTEEELIKMIALYKDNSLDPNYQKVLQFFLFCCFSSLHIGDAKNIKIEQLTGKTFNYYRKKNRNSKPEPIIVPISTPLRHLIKDIRGGRARGPLFEDLVSDQKINEYIKKIATSIGINKGLSTKSGRHTFATLFLNKTKDMATLKEILGHSDYRETLLYAHVLEDSKLNGIKTFNNFDL